MQRQAHGLVIVSDPYMFYRRVEIVTLAAYHALPTVYPLRDFAVAGGFLSYGSSIVEAFRQQGAFVGHILKGATPADLPVQQPTKVDLTLNQLTARALGLDVPISLLLWVDEVFE